MTRTRIQLTAAFLIAAVPALAQQGQPGAHFIENWDLDGDGQVTAAEAEERRGYVFAAFDSNKDGQLDAEEYTYFDEARANDMAQQGNHGRGAMKRAAEGMTLQANDHDANGAVSEAEFLSGAAGWIADMDQNGDGVVTLADFGPGQGQRAPKG